MAGLLCTLECVSLGSLLHPVWGPAFSSHLSQILQLTHLAPEIQEQLLFLPPTRHGSDRIVESHVRPLARLVDWEAQKQRFRALREQLSL
jgi:hypothetical protein